MTPKPRRNRKPLNKAKIAFLQSKVKGVSHLKLVVDNT